MTRVAATLQLDLSNGKWNVVKHGRILGPYDTIKEAHTAKSELSRRGPRKVVGFRQDGTEITRRAA